MPVPVVDLLEVVQIKQQESRSVILLMDIEIGLDVLSGVFVIVQSCERVEPSLPKQLVMPDLAAGDVQKNADVDRSAVFVCGASALFQNPDHAAVGLAHSVLFFVILGLVA